VGGALFQANTDHSIQVRMVDLFKWHQYQVTGHQYQVAGPCCFRSSVWGVPCSEQMQTTLFKPTSLNLSSGVKWVKSGVKWVKSGVKWVKWC